MDIKFASNCENIKLLCCWLIKFNFIYYLISKICLFFLDWNLLFSQLNSKMITILVVNWWNTRCWTIKSLKFLIDDFENVYIFSFWLTENMQFFRCKQAKFSRLFAIDSQDEGFERGWFLKCDAFSGSIEQTHENFEPNTCLFFFRYWLHKIIIS